MWAWMGFDYPRPWRLVAKGGHLRFFPSSEKGLLDDEERFSIHVEVTQPQPVYELFGVKNGSYHAPAIRIMLESIGLAPFSDNTLISPQHLPITGEVGTCRAKRFGVSVTARETVHPFLSVGVNNVLKEADDLSSRAEDMKGTIAAYGQAAHSEAKRPLIPIQSGH